jgi:hypothetical protein
VRHCGMSWTTTTDVDLFLAEAEPFLAADPVANNVLLTEARFWQRLSDRTPPARFGWWSQDGATRSAFLHLPDHPPLCSPLVPGSVAGLPGELDADRVAVDARDLTAVTAAWAAHGLAPAPRARLTLLRLHDLRPRPVPEGTARVAGSRDRPLLAAWFALFGERHPDDASHEEFVVDQPLEDGGIVVWEVAGHPVAMASRTPRAAGAVRMGLAFQPADGTAYADAAFDRACAEAAGAADHVLVLSADRERTATYRSLGFEPVLDRAVLELPPA